MSEVKNVIIAGAGGNLGAPVLKEFLGSDFNVSVLSRNDSKSTFPPGVKVIRTDYTRASLEAALKGQDAVISFLNGSAITNQQITLVDAAIAAGVKRFLPSEFGSNTNDPRTIQLVPIFSGKRHVVEYLQNKQSDTFSWSALITGPFFDWGLAMGFLRVNYQEKKMERWDGGNIPFSSTNTYMIGKALVSLLKPANLQSTANKYVYIASYTITQNQLIDVVKKATGGKWTIVDVDSAQVEKHSREQFVTGNLLALYGLIQVATYGKYNLGDFSTMLSNEALGLPKEDLTADLNRVFSEIKKASK